MNARCTRCYTYNPLSSRFCVRCGQPTVGMRMETAPAVHDSVAGAYLAACVIAFGLASVLTTSWTEGVALTNVQRLGSDAAVAFVLWLVLWAYLRLPLWSAFTWVGGWVMANGWLYVGAEWVVRTHPRVDPLLVAAAHGVVLGFLTWAALRPSRVSLLWITQTTCALVLVYLMPTVVADVRFPMELYARVAPMVAGALLGIAQAPCLLSATQVAGRRAGVPLPVGVARRAAIR